MKTIYKKVLICLCMLISLCGCAGNQAEVDYYDALSDEEKTVIYQEYLDNIINKLTDVSYYIYDVTIESENVYYQVYNKAGYKQYDFMQGSKEGFIVDIDHEYTYIYLDCFKEVHGDVLRTTSNQAIKAILDEYEYNVDDIINDLEVTSIQKTSTILQEKYYADEVQIKATINNEEYTATATYYINKDKQVKVHENMDILIIATFDNGTNKIGLTLYQNEDPTKERDQYEYKDVSVDDFIQELNTQLSK